MHPLPHFRQTKVWDESGRDAARSFCLLRFSFAALHFGKFNMGLNGTFLPEVYAPFGASILAVVCR